MTATQVRRQLGLIRQDVDLYQKPGASEGTGHGVVRNLKRLDHVYDDLTRRARRVVATYRTSTDRRQLRQAREEWERIRPLLQEYDDLLTRFRQGRKLKDKRLMAYQTSRTFPTHGVTPRFEQFMDQKYREYFPVRLSWRGQRKRERDVARKIRRAERRDRRAKERAAFERKVVRHNVEQGKTRGQVFGRRRLGLSNAEGIGVAVYAKFQNMSERERMGALMMPNVIGVLPSAVKKYEELKAAREKAARDYLKSLREQVARERLEAITRLERALGGLSGSRAGVTSGGTGWGGSAAGGHLGAVRGGASANLQRRLAVPPDKVTGQVPAWGGGDR